MLHESEKTEFTALSVIFIAVWVALVAAPYNIDTSHWAGISKLWLTPFFAPWVAMFAAILGGTWFARLTENDAWLLNRSFWPKQLFIWLPLLSTLIIAQIGK